MSTASIVSRAFEVFHTDAAATPPLALRGANAVDGYHEPMPFNPAEDESWLSTSHRSTCDR